MMLITTTALKIKYYFVLPPLFQRSDSIPFNVIKGKEFYSNTPLP
jgi:hypothetical protein